MEASRTLDEISTDRDMWAYQKDMLAIDRNSAFAAAEERGIKKGKAEGLAEGKAAGLAEGEEKGKIQTARMLKQKNISIDIIEECTGLSRDEIESL